MINATSNRLKSMSDENCSHGHGWDVKCCSPALYCLDDGVVLVEIGGVEAAMECLGLGVYVYRPIPFAFLPPRCQPVAAAAARC